MKRAHKRLTFVAFGVGLLAVALALVLSALDDTLVFFKTPSEIAGAAAAPPQRLRVGGLVEEGSVERGSGESVAFRVTDLSASLPVRYTGILPDLFREGQGVVVEGQMRDGVLIADQVLAKHDERYMPPEAAEALKRSGQWQHMRDSLQQAGQIPAQPGAPPR